MSQRQGEKTPPKVPPHRDENDAAHCGKRERVQRVNPNGYGTRRSSDVAKAILVNCATTNWEKGVGCTRPLIKRRGHTENNVETADSLIRTQRRKSQGREKGQESISLPPHPGHQGESQGRRGPWEPHSGGNSPALKPWTPLQEAQRAPGGKAPGSVLPQFFSGLQTPNPGGSRRPQQGRGRSVAGAGFWCPARDLPAFQHSPRQETQSRSRTRVRSNTETSGTAQAQAHRAGSPDDGLPCCGGQGGPTANMI